MVIAKGNKRIILNIWIFEEYGLAFILCPRRNLYFLLGFIGINIIWRE